MAVEDHENGRVPCNVGPSNRLHLVKEHSFYKNTYAMVRLHGNYFIVFLTHAPPRPSKFTDPTSYQALFYFLVIKPAITLLITILLIALGIPSFILILPRDSPRKKESRRVAGQYCNRGIVPRRAVTLTPWCHPSFSDEYLWSIYWGIRIILLTLLSDFSLCYIAIFPQQVHTGWS